MKTYPISNQTFLGLIFLLVISIFIPFGTFAQIDNKPILRFGMLSDVHYADRELAGTRYYRQSYGKVQEFVDLMNSQKVNFVIELGDFKDQDSVPNESNTLNYLTTIESVFHQFNGLTYHVLGNHDMDGISKEQFLNRVTNSCIPPSKSYYSFNQNSFHFIVLDGNFTKEGKEYDHGNFSWNDAFIPEMEVNWLKDDLKSNKFPVIVFIHQMLDDSKSVEQSVRNAADIRHVLEQSGKVLCVFQGHVHEERYSLINNIHYYSVNAVVDGDGPENNSYEIVDIYNDGSLKINGYRRATDRELIK